MVSRVLSVPLSEDLQRRLNAQTEIRWVEVVRNDLDKRLKVLEEMDELTKDSKLTIEDTVRIGRQIKKDAWRKVEKPALDKYLSSLTRTSSSRQSPATA